MAGRKAPVTRHCPICTTAQTGNVTFANEHAAAFPAAGTTRHSIIVAPKRHCRSLGNAGDSAYKAIWELVAKVQETFSDPAVLSGCINITGGAEHYPSTDHAHMIVTERPRSTAP